MRLFDFLQLIPLKHKVVFVTGRFFEIISVSISGYCDLKNYREFLSNLTRLGFDYELTPTTLIASKGNKRIHLRRDGSDYDVFKQIVINRGYQAVVDCLKLNNITPKLIIDAGSNIGLSSLMFDEEFPSCKFICLEPDPNNFRQLEMNSRLNKNFLALNEALWINNEQLFLGNDFRDGSYWSMSVSSKPTSLGLQVSGTSLQTLIERFDIREIDLLKMDIEGSESQIFSDLSDVSFLNKVKVIAIEIHDEFNCRERIYDKLRQYGFTLFNSGELTIGFHEGN